MQTLAAHEFSEKNRCSRYNNFNESHLFFSEYSGATRDFGIIILTLAYPFSLKNDLISKILQNLFYPPLKFYVDLFFWFLFCFCWSCPDLFCVLMSAVWRVWWSGDQQDWLLPNQLSIRLIITRPWHTYQGSAGLGTSQGGLLCRAF